MTGEQSENITVTERAARRIANIVAPEDGKTMLRLSVEGGGCSGFQYKFDLIAAPDNDDIVVTREGASVAIDQMSMLYLHGAEIDFVDDLLGASFRVNNPNAAASCGCGTSFSI